MLKKLFVVFHEAILRIKFETMRDSLYPWNYFTKFLFVFRRASLQFTYLFIQCPCKHLLSPSTIHALVRCKETDYRVQINYLLVTKDFIINLSSSTCFNYLYCVLKNSIPVWVKGWLFLKPFSKFHEFVSSNACYSFLFVQYCLGWEETRDNCLEECWIFLEENWISHSVFKIFIGRKMAVITKEIEAKQFWWNNDVGIVLLQSLRLFYCMP